MSFAALVYRMIQQFGYPKLRRVCVAAITFDRDNSLDISKWDMAPYADGTHYLGEDVVSFLRRHDLVILQHWMPAEAIVYLKSLGLKVLLWCEIEAVQGNPWRGCTDEQRKQRETIWRHLLVGTDGVYVDIYEGIRRENPAWAVNMLSPTLVDNLREMFQSFAHLGASGYFIDSMTDQLLGLSNQRTSTARSFPSLAADRRGGSSSWSRLG